MVKALHDVLSEHGIDGEDGADQLILELTDLDPKLLVSLGAAALMSLQAEDEEDIAQAALSGRRYIEKLADKIFPPQKNFHKGRRVDKAAYRNRIWAYIGENSADPQLTRLGKRVDDLDGVFNSGLHAKIALPALRSGISEAAKLTTDIFRLNPDGLREAYAPYEDAIVSFYEEVFGFPLHSK